MQAGSLHTACGAALLDEEHQTMFPGFAFDMARKPDGEASVVKTYFHVPAVLLFPAYRQGVFVERETPIITQKPQKFNLRFLFFLSVGNTPSKLSFKAQPYPDSSFL